MAALALRDPVKGARQAAEDEEKISLHTAAAAQYLSTDHDTDAGRLVQGQVDHALLVGHRVASSAEEVASLEAEFAKDVGEGCQLGICPACQRSVTHGEFGVDHIAYYLEGDEERTTRKIRSMPRIWCTPCAKAHAKRQKKPYLRSRDEESLRGAWQGFVEDVRRDQGQDVQGREPAPAPGNEATAKLWAWLARVLASKELVEVAKAKFRVTAVRPRGDLDLAAKSFRLEVAVTYQAAASLVTGELVVATGTSVIALSLAPGADACSVEVVSNGAAKLKNDPGLADPGLMDRAVQKVELLARIWGKKGLAKLVLSRLGDLHAKAVKLMG